ncbi:hypothetical protein CQ054_21080 [Ochrobactrum sp. MYb29]|nr:hypothetical protein CWE02_09610 [Brucella pituitosa]PRA80520.1 hypothetical protein CQ054_21080 [Ochrobactrum sp. MYb29]TCQ72944.1 hypothetical protein EDF68_1207 [Ochrobactrum sp. BH3]
MLKFSFLTAGLWLSIVTLAHSAEAVGFREVEVDKESPRPLYVAIWYLTEEQTSMRDLTIWLETQNCIFVCAIWLAFADERSSDCYVMARSPQSRYL